MLFRSVTVTAIVNAPQNGAIRRFYGLVNTVWTNNAMFAIDGAANFTFATGDYIDIEAITTSTYKVHITKADGRSAASGRVLNSMVRLNTANGYGSTNTKIRRFTNTVTSQGTDITYADSVTLGATFTINTSDVYAISFSDNYSSVADVGLSLNTTQPTLVISGIPVAEILSTSTSGGVNFSVSCGWTGYLVAGSIVRAHTQGISTGTITTATQFTISRMV